METTNDIQSTLPLTETTYFILLSLAHGPRHGYAIMKDVAELSRGRVALSTGTLYSALKRLLDQGWIRRSPEPGSVLDGRGRKAYTLTSLGDQILEAEIGRLQGLVNVAHGRKLGKAQPESGM
jgi:DNA-binding PadR family transcriptional regulator